jgi:hypothetical protein
MGKPTKPPCRRIYLQARVGTEEGRYTQKHSTSHSSTKLPKKPKRIQRKWPEDRIATKKGKELKS